MKQSSKVLLQETAQKPSDKLMVKYFEQEDANLHDHDCFELAYVVEGSAVQNLNGTMEPVSQGAYFIIDYGSKHSYQDCKNLKLINCLFQPEIVNASLGNCISFDELMRICMIRYYKNYPDWTPADSIFYDEDKKVLHLLEEMMEEYEHREIGYQEIFRGKLLEILLITMRKVVQKKAMVSVRSSEKSDLILDAVNYLEKNYRSKAPLSRFCEKKHYSIQYVSRKFKKETGVTFLEYLQKVRIRKSCDLLIESEMLIPEVADQVGYDDMKYFHHIFRKIVGMTPGEYRKVVRDEEEPREQQEPRGQIP